MDRVLVSVRVPSLNMCFDISIPRFMPIEDIIALLTVALEGATGKQYSPSKGELLCWYEKAIVLNGKKTFSDYGIKNGELLYLY